MDGIIGQSTGKSVMRIKVSLLDDKHVDLAHVDIESLESFSTPLRLHPWMVAISEEKTETIQPSLFY